MENEKIIYSETCTCQGKSNIVKNLDLNFYNSYSKKAQKFIQFTIKFADKHRADIDVFDCDTKIKIDLYIKVGVFFGYIKNMFIELLNTAEDFLMFPLPEVDSPFPFHICLYHSKHEK